MTSMWQHPHVNLFKQFGVGQWKKCSKEGDVTSHMDRDIKATVYRISGSIPSSNYIQLPKSTSQSLNLTGRYLYVLFRPQAEKYFVVHIEVVTNQGMVIRISFSNLFKEFKSTSTWLQFPYSSSLVNKENHCESSSNSSEKRDDKPSLHVQWTLLTLDLKAILSHYLHSNYAYLKNVKLCSSLLVKNVFTSDLEYSPLASADRPKTPSGESIRQYVHPLPREMTFMVTRGHSFTDTYDYIRFPSSEAPIEQVKPVLSHAHLKGHNPAIMSIVGESSDDFETETSKAKSHSSGGAPKFDAHQKRRSQTKVEGKKGGGSEQSSAKENLVEKHHSRHSSARSDQTGDRRLRRHDVAMQEGDLQDEHEGYEEVHVYAERGAEVAVHHEGEENRDGNTASGTKAKEKRSIILRTGPKKPTFKSLQPDPIMKLSKVIGFGGHTTSEVLFSGDSKSVVYPCHSLVVDMDISSGKQRFFIGHTDKISCLSMNSDGSLLASGQMGSVALVRVWNFNSAQCLALFKTHHGGLHTLSFSHSGGVLCGVGKDRHGKSQVVVWNTSRVTHSGEVCVLARAHTDVSIERMRVAGFDDSRMVSCGWDNIRFWRVRNGALRSCPVNLEEHHQLHFTDVMFQPGYHSDGDLTNRNVYACTKNGYLFEINYKRIVVRRVWHLLPHSGGVAIQSLYLHEAFCVTGSEDGMLRVWPLDFSAVFMEAASALCALGCLALDNGLGLTPQMGWNSWNHFHCGVNQTVLQNTADAFIKLGLDKLGYVYVNVDDCWAGSRDSNKVIVPDTKTFPDFQGMIKYIHSKGIKFGLYSDAGTNTCAGRPGSLGYEEIDAKTYAQWNVDYLKYDNCHNENEPAKERYTAMRDALNKTGHPIFYSLCNGGREDVATWGSTVGNSWRTTHDIKDNWESMIERVDINAVLANDSGPGGWNDPDMLEVGNGGMTTTEYKTHFSLWCLMKAPLLIGCDLTKIDNESLRILSNSEAIAVNQDKMGVQGTRRKTDGTNEVWAGPLDGGAYAVILLNRGTATANITASWYDFGMDPSKEADVRDLWQMKDLGNMKGSVTASVPSHGVAMYKITPE